MSPGALALVVGLLVVAAAGVVLLAVLANGALGSGWGMMGGWGPSSGVWFVGALMMVVPLALLLFFVVLFLRPLAPNPPMYPPSAGASTPEEALRLRYAKGEISSEQYHEILRDLR